MTQSLIAYALVAAAAGWTLWSLGARRWFRTRAAARGTAKTETKCDPDCGCGD